MATNAEEKTVDDSKAVTAQDLHDLKYGTTDVEDSSESDEIGNDEKESDDKTGTGEEDETNSADQATDESEESGEQDFSEEEAGFVKELPNIKGESVEEYARSLEKAYQASTTEALRLKSIVDSKPEARVGDDDQSAPAPTDPVSLYVKQKMDEEISKAFSDFQKVYPQAVPGTPEYNQFVAEVQTFSQTILTSQKRLAPPSELYRKAAVSLGWEPNGKMDDGDKLKVALKSSAGSARIASSGAASAKKSKVTDKMIAVNKLMYPDKTDAQIREELEPYVK